MEQDDKGSVPTNGSGKDQNNEHNNYSRPSEAAGQTGEKPRGIHKHFDIHPPVFWSATILLIVFIAVTLIVGEPMERVFDTMQNWISDHFGWFLVLVVNFYLLLALYFAFSRFGNIRLGGRNAVPEFSRRAWFSMLFSAGMGIGILFWSVAEPIFHFTDPPVDMTNPTAAAQEAMKTTFLHWGLHAWAIYTLVGLALAFFSFNRNMPLAFRSVFYPLLGDKVYRWPGDVIDVLAVLATLFGLATSLGLGVKQVSAGLSHLFNSPDTLNMRVILIAAITAAATISVVLGLNKGVKKLSEMNINLGAILLVFILILGPTLFILDSYAQNLGNYLNDFFQKSFWTESYQASNWQNDWTIFYWSWWISWSPFVGMFIARISRGRTIQEYVLSVLIVPTLLTFFWITAFGGSALFLELQEAAGIAAEVKQNVATSIYHLFERFPLAEVTNFAAIVLVISFFVTSSDSGSLVVDAFTSGGKLRSPVTQRIFWASMEGAVAAILLVGGGLKALQTAAITTGLPFAIILIIMGFSLRKGLKKEQEKEELRRKAKERESYKELVQELIEKDRAGQGQDNSREDQK
ncbi:MAG: BCCT family transporter [Bacteroidales bacterium]|nr:BCCT family transporter [Bacteroidales bacterium]